MLKKMGGGDRSELWKWLKKEGRRGYD